MKAKAAKKSPPATKQAAAKKSGIKSTAKKAAPKTAAKSPSLKTTASNTPRADKPAKPGSEPKLLSGGNPQIAKGYGDAPVQAYIAAMPGWKSDLGRRVDAIITRTVPGVLKAVKWNSPMYGIEEGRWFISYHCFAKYLKVAFFRGASLNPPPPGESTQAEVRYLNIREDDELDEKQFASWVKQASKLPGEKM